MNQVSRSPENVLEMQVRRLLPDTLIQNLPLDSLPRWLWCGWKFEKCCPNRDPENDQQCGLSRSHPWSHLSSAVIPWCASYLLHKVDHTWWCFVVDQFDRNSFQSLSAFHLVSQVSKCLKAQQDWATSKCLPVQRAPLPVSQKQRLPLNTNRIQCVFVD